MELGRSNGSAMGTGKTKGASASAAPDLFCGHADPNAADRHADDRPGRAAATASPALNDPLSPPGVDNVGLEQRIVEALRLIYDPEIPVNIYDLGLIYGIEIYPLGRVTIHMTLTSPACPVAGSLPPEVEQSVRAVDGVTEATVELVWEPPWSIDRMSEEAKLELNLL